MHIIGVISLCEVVGWPVGIAEESRTSVRPSEPAGAGPEDFSGPRLQLLSAVHRVFSSSDEKATARPSPDRAEGQS